VEIGGGILTNVLVDLVLDPVAVLMKVKQEKNMGFSLGIAALIGLIVAVIVIATVGLFAFSPLSSSSAVQGMSGVTLVIEFILAAVVVFILEVAGGLLVSRVMKTLGGTGAFFEGLSAIAVSCFVASISGLIAIFAIITSRIPYLGLIIGAIIGFVALVYFAMSLALFYRSLKELFETDMITAFVGTSILTVAIFVSVYGITVLLIYTMGPALPMPSFGHTGLFSLLG